MTIIYLSMLARMDSLGVSGRFYMNEWEILKKKRSFCGFTELTLSIHDLFKEFQKVLYSLGTMLGMI